MSVYCFPYYLLLVLNRSGVYYSDPEVFSWVVPVFVVAVDFF